MLKWGVYFWGSFWDPLFESNLGPTWVPNWRGPYSKLLPYSPLSHSPPQFYLERQSQPESPTNLSFYLSCCWATSKSGGVFFQFKNRFHLRNSDKRQNTSWFLFGTRPLCCKCGMSCLVLPWACLVLGLLLCCLALSFFFVVVVVVAFYDEEKQ